MPMVDLPGMTSTTRTLITDSERARSLAKPVTWLTFTPAARSSSKRVTTGPGWTSTTCASMPNSSSFSSRRLESACSASADRPTTLVSESSSRLSGGSVGAMLGAGSNSSTWRSASTRSTISTGRSTGSMRGGLRLTSLALWRSTDSRRSSRARLPATPSAYTRRPRPATVAPLTTAMPSSSVSFSHENPVTQVMPDRPAAARKSVAPAVLRLPAARRPSSRPSPPPGPLGSAPCGR